MDKHTEIIERIKSNPAGEYFISELKLRLSLRPNVEVEHSSIEDTNKFRLLEDLLTLFTK